VKGYGKRQVWCVCSVKAVLSTPERFSCKFLTMGRYTNDCLFFSKMCVRVLFPGNVAPIHPGSIPSPGIGASSVAQLALQSRTSIGAGISPVLLAQVSDCCICKCHQNSCSFDIFRMIAALLVFSCVYIHDKQIQCNLINVSNKRIYTWHLKTKIANCRKPQVKQMCI